MVVKTTKAKEATALSAKQDAFCRIYAICNNGTRAYQEAYPDSNLNSARASAPGLLAKPSIQAKIAEYREIEKADTVILVHELKKRIRKIILSQLDDCEMMLEIVRERVNLLKDDESLSERKLLDLSKIRSGEMEIFVKLIDALAQLEGLNVMESTLLDMLKRTEAQLELN